MSYFKATFLSHDSFYLGVLAEARGRDPCSASGVVLSFNYPDVLPVSRYLETGNNPSFSNRQKTVSKAKKLNSDR
jgi:hypothetical protein